MARAGRSDGSREAVIGRTTRVRGRVSGDGDLLVEGSVDGDISVRGDLVLGDSARASSSIDANAVTIRGELDGDVRARGVVRIESGARVKGDVHGESFSLEEGAEFAGRLDAEFDLPAELGGGSARERRR
jgi:cytoskeletal protein CcmA (bactofilin family)